VKWRIANCRCGCGKIELLAYGHPLLVGVEGKYRRDLEELVKYGNQGLENEKAPTSSEAEPFCDDPDCYRAGCCLKTTS
jgi:hypothetical protein